jgi:hypothetical protein
MKGKEKICGTPVDICAKEGRFGKRLWNYIIFADFGAQEFQKMEVAQLPESGQLS